MLHNFLNLCSITHYYYRFIFCHFSFLFVIMIKNTHFTNLFKRRSLNIIAISLFIFPFQYFHFLSTFFLFYLCLCYIWSENHGRIVEVILFMLKSVSNDHLKNTDTQRSDRNDSKLSNGWSTSIINYELALREILNQLLYTFTSHIRS